MLLNNLFEGIKQEINNIFRQIKWKHNAKPLNATETVLHGKFIKVKKNQTKLKDTITGIKNMLEGMNSALDDTKEQISKLEEKV